MRYYAAVLTGAMTQIASMAYMWLYTDMEACNMLTWSLILYFASVSVFLAITAPKINKKREKQRVFCVYDLKKEWGENV